MKALIALILLLGLGLALNTASCTSLAPACAAAGAGGAAGSGGMAGTSSCAGTGGGNTTCPALTARQACFSAFCQADGAGTPFCGCFTRGYELGPAPDCSCTVVSAADTAAYCQENEGVDASSVDCSVLTSSVATACVGVQ